MSKFPHLFTPLELGPATLRNRLTMSAHTRELGAERYERYLAARAKGGVAGITVLASFGLINNATTPGRFMKRYATESDAFLPVADDPAAVTYVDGREIPRLAGIAAALHPHETLVFGQLHHAGADRVTAAGTDPLQ